MCWKFSLWFWIERGMGGAIIHSMMLTRFTIAIKRFLLALILLTCVPLVADNTATGGVEYVNAAQNGVTKATTTQDTQIGKFIEQTKARDMQIETVKEASNNYWHFLFPVEFTLPIYRR